MSRSHGHRFANEALPDQLFDNPLAFTRTLANQRTGLQLLASAWDQAGARLPAVDRVSRAGLSATFEQRGAYVAITISVPPPRELGDPCAIAIVGVGDGQTGIERVQYFVLELDRSVATDGTRFIISTRGEPGDSVTLGEGPPPDTRWFIDHVCELVARRQPPAPRIPLVPAWYYWHAFRGDEAMRAFLQANDFAQQLAVVKRMPILMLPEIAEAADVFLTGGATSQSLRAFHAALRAEAAFAPTCQILATLLANTRSGAAGANLARAIAILTEAREHGADLGPSYLLEAEMRKALATAGIDVRKNYETAQKLLEMAGPQPVPGERTRMARGSTASYGDPTWTQLFLDESELSHYRRADDRRAEETPPGAIHAGHVAWVGDERWPMWRIIDTRYVFPTSDAAEKYLRRVMGLIGDGLPALPTPELADATIAFGGASPGRIPGTRHAAQSIVVRVGRVIAKLYVVEGPGAPQTGHVLAQPMLVPLAQRIVSRVQYMLARYWLAVGRGADAAALFAETANPRLLAAYPILALPEFPAAMLTLGGTYARSAEALWKLQTQLRGQQWQAHREATRALVRTLLDDTASEPHVNAACAQALVNEMRRLDSDPIWAALEAECRARA